jgi:DNA-binding GntR family transcriptional regulator
MPLPFLKNKINQPGMIIETRKPDENPSQEEESNDDEGLEMAASDLIDAIHNKDPKAAASAMRAAFELMESQPPDESNEEEQGEEE